MLLRPGAPGLLRWSGGAFDLQALAHLGPQAIAEAIVSGFHKKHDDASCAVARTMAVSAGSC